MMRSVRSVLTTATLSGVFVLAIGFPSTAPMRAAAVPDKTVTVAIRAQVEFVDDLAGLLCVAVAPGDIITGTYTYTLGPPDSNDPVVSDHTYNAPPNEITLQLGGATTRTDPSRTLVLIELVNSVPGAGSDRYFLFSYKNLPLSCGTSVEFITWDLDDPTAKHCPIRT